MSQLKVNSIVDAAGGSSAILYGVASPPNSMGFRNRIINGEMRIDQRNGGASVTPSTGQYTLDRWRGNSTQASKYTIQRNAGAVTPPVGFTNYLGVTSLSAYAVSGNDSFAFEQIIEGYNISDLNWGTANAIPATLSFWVRSSLTGTFGASLATANGTIWVVPFSYTIALANTWTYITVAIPAGTSAVPFTDNQSGIFVRFGLGSSGTSAGGTPGVWTSAGNYIQPAGTVSVVGTNGATFYITGVQLEAGSVASPFERRDIGRELMMCQRYYWQLTNITPTVGTYRTTTVLEGTQVSWPVSMRTSPTCALPSLAGLIFVNGGATAITGAPSVGPAGTNAVFISLSSAAQPQNAAAWANITSTLTISAEL